MACNARAACERGSKAPISPNTQMVSTDIRQTGIGLDHWLPVGRSNSFRRRTLNKISIAGEDIVIARTESGNLFALEDRCSHRQIPLSQGRVAGEAIRCCYHGWEFDLMGHCRVPPNQADYYSPLHVRRYPLKELHGLVFLFFGDARLAQTVPLPCFDEAESRNYITIRIVEQIDCHFTFVHENLMDMTHHSSLHSKWMGAFRPAVIGSRSGEDFVEVEYSAQFSGGNLLFRSLYGFMFGLKREAVDARDQKQNDIISVGTHYPYQYLIIRRSLDNCFHLKLWLTCVPVDAQQRSCKPIGLLIVRKPRIRLLVHLIKPLYHLYARIIFGEDRMIMEQEQLAYERGGQDHTVERRPYLVELRELLIRKGVRLGDQA